MEQSLKNKILAMPSLQNNWMTAAEIRTRLRNAKRAGNDSLYSELSAMATDGDLDRRKRAIGCNKRHVDKAPFEYRIPPDVEYKPLQMAWLRPSGYRLVRELEEV